ncbi:MAG: hypothetical protein Q8P42_00030 [Gallionella sp.]|nr:hypothetical protein [Gallionella sp.]
MTTYAELNWVKHPERTMQQLIDARKRLDDDELKDAIEEVLDQRFPHWQNKDVGIVASGQKAQTYAQFRGKQKVFAASKNAYAWLIGEMLNTRSHLAFGGSVFQEMFVKGIRGARYLALVPEDLFPAKSNVEIRAMKDNFWHELPNGWALYLKLNGNQKLDRLRGLAAVCGLEYERDWNWHVEGEEESDLSDFDEIFAQAMLDSKA